MLITLYYLMLALMILLLGTLLYMRFFQTQTCYEDIYNTGVDAYFRQDYNAAIKSFKTAIKAGSDRPEAYYNLGLTYLALGNLSQAEFNFSKAIELNSQDSDAYYNLGLLLYNKGQYANASEQFQAAIKLKDDDPDSYYNYGLSLAMSVPAKYDEAIIQYNKAIELDANNFDYVCALAQAYDRKSDSSGMMRDIDAAIDMYKAVLALNEHHEESNFRLAICYAKKGMWEDSVNSCEKVIEINPNSAEAHNQLGLALYCRGDIDEAIVMYKKALELVPGFNVASRNLGYAYEKQGNFEDAIRTFNKYVTSSPDSDDTESIKKHIEELEESIKVKS